jgi:HEAT repeat protein
MLQRSSACAALLALCTLGWIACRDTGGGQARPLAALSEAPAVVAGPDVMQSAFCADCHPDVYAEHEQSTHGRAFTDAEVRLATARFDLQDCIICHTPRPIFETGVGQNPRRRHHDLEGGNTCMTCHWKPGFDYARFQGGDECRTAFHPDVGTVEACASCHRNHGTPYQWEKSPTGKATGRECVDCHMETVERPVAVGGPVREVRRHVFPGGRSESQLRRAYAYTAAIEGDHAVVTIRNQGAGHNFPTELKQRSVESLVVVKDAAGAEVARSRMVFRDPYKRPYGLDLPVNTQIPGGEERVHRVPIGVSSGTVETTLFYKLYYPIDDYHSDLSRVLESRALPFDGLTPSRAPVEGEPELLVVTPEDISPEDSSVANLVDYARPPIGTVAVDLPEGDGPADIARLIELFQFPVPQANAQARARLARIGLPAVPALIEALGSWDNKTYNQAMAVLEKIGTPARQAIVTALASEQLYVRLHARELVARMAWSGADVAGPVAAALAAPAPLDRASAANAAGRLRLVDAAARLEPLLADGDPDVVREAALALATLGRREAEPALEAALERARFDETRRDLAFALARLGSARGVPVLLRGLDHGDDLIRESFFEALFEVTAVHLGYDPLAPRPERLDAIADLQAWWAAAGGAHALVAPDPEADPVAEAHARHLVGELGGDDLKVSDSQTDRALEAELLGMGRNAVPALVRGLKYPAGFAAKRALVCKLLGQLRDPRAAPALAATLRDPVVSVAAWAAWALEALGDPATQPALARYEQRVRKWIGEGRVPPEAGSGDQLLLQAARARLAVGDRSAARTLATLLLSAEESVRASAIEALARETGDARGFDAAGPQAERRAAAARWME